MLVLQRPMPEPVVATSGGDLTMTTQAEDLLGARVSGADGKVVGTIEQVFRDDVDGTPAWARVRSGKIGRFVPLGSCQVTADGVTVPFDAQKIMGGPNIDAGQHMSAAQAEELTRYYGLTIPTQQPRGETGETGQMAPGPMAEGDWLVRQEERLQVGIEQLETGRVRLHKYVDVENIEQPVHLFHEEYEIERIPLSADDQSRISSDLAEGELEIILHEERPVLRKERVPVERVRLRPRRVEEDTTVRDQVRRERIEIEPDQAFASTRRDEFGTGR
jgi:uncharacterized protein (TIGR02271 family)